MFWITISGLPMITIPSLFNSSTTFNTALWAWRSDFAPVQTIFPVLKIRVAVFGFLNRYTRPGNRSGRYSTPGKTRTIVLRSIRCFSFTEATTFSILMYALLLPDRTCQHSNLTAQVIQSHTLPPRSLIDTPPRHDTLKGVSSQEARELRGFGTCICSYTRGSDCLVWSPQISNC